MTKPPPPPSAHPWWPYVVPLAAFLALNSAEWLLPKLNGGPHPIWYPVGYAVKIAIVAALAWAGRSAWHDFRPAPAPRMVGLAVGVGVAVAVGWVGLDAIPFPRPGESGARQAFNPWSLPPAGRVAFLAVRMFGLVLVVPLIEELFWRSFLMRSVIDMDDFRRVPVGRVTLLAAAVTSALFASAHPAEWLQAALTGLAWAWLLHYTRSLAACVISHAVANLGLGIYVLLTGAWKFW